MKVGVIGAGTMGQGIAKAFAQVDGYEVALCDIKQEWADGGKEKIKKGYARLVEKGKMTQEAVDGILAKITPGLKEDLCKDCDLIVEAAFEDMGVKKTTFQELDKIAKPVHFCIQHIQPFHHRDRQRTDPSNGRYAFLQPGRPYEVNRGYRRCEYTGRDR